MCVCGVVGAIVLAMAIGLGGLGFVLCPLLEIEFFLRLLLSIGLLLLRRRPRLERVEHLLVLVPHSVVGVHLVQVLEELRVELRHQLGEGLELWSLWLVGGRLHEAIHAVF